MPFKYECREHPDWTGDHLSVVMEHVDDEHPLDDYMTLRDDRTITCQVIRQNEAQGNPNHHIFVCRTCGVSVNRLATDELFDVPYCTPHAVGKTEVHHG